jgi:hypothetical protein
MVSSEVPDRGLFWLDDFASTGLESASLGMRVLMAVFARGEVGLELCAARAGGIIGGAGWEFTAVNIVIGREEEVAGVTWEVATS